MLTAMAGIVVGAGLTYLWWFSERRMHRVPEPATPPVVPAGASDVLAVLSSSAVLVGDDDMVLQTSAPAAAMGLVRDGRIDSAEVLDLIHQVRRTGVVGDADFEIPLRRRPPLFVHTRVAPLGSRTVLVLVEDRTRENQVETIRRDFVANVSHELKTPLGALKLLAEAVAEATDDPEAVTRFSQRMTVETERLTRLVQQIIDLSRLQYNTASSDASLIAVSDLVTEAVEHSAIDAEAKSITIKVSVDTETHLLGDRSQLHSALSNLVENAVTYSPDGSTVHVSATRGTDDDADTVQITVTDNGIGLDDNELERIFERFYRVDPARARTTGGTGLGLSIVKHVAASNGGTVEVWSKPGLGSSFTLALPAHDLDEENP